MSEDAKKAGRLLAERLAALVESGQGRLTLPPISGESTSARLRRVERERDDLAIRAADLEQVREELTQELATSAGLLERLIAVEYQRDELASEVRVLKNSDALETVKAEAELASARTELEYLRDRRYRRYDNKLCPRCGVELEAEVAAEQASHPTTNEGEPTA